MIQASSSGKLHPGDIQHRRNRRLYAPSSSNVKCEVFASKSVGYKLKYGKLILPSYLGKVLHIGTTRAMLFLALDALTIGRPSQTIKPRQSNGGASVYAHFIPANILRSTYDRANESTKNMDVTATLCAGEYPSTKVVAAHDTPKPSTALVKASIAAMIRTAGLNHPYQTARRHHRPVTPRQIDTRLHRHFLGFHRRP